MISREEVHRLAKLARIDVPEEEEGKLQKDLEAILGYVEKLKEVDISDVPEMTHAIEARNVFRADEVNPPAGGGGDDKNILLTDQFPEEEAGYLKVKGVFGS